MFSWLANAWKVPELRKRVLFTALILALYRLGAWMPAPGVNSAMIKRAFQNQNGTVISLLNLFSGGALSKFSLFALGIMPYITASIIMQLMTAAVPKLEQLQKEGESGYAKITQYTRYFTVGLSLIQAMGWTYLFHRQGDLPGNAGRYMLIILTLTAGSVLLMWLGELITKRGVGNGISLLVFASIIDGLYGGLQVWINGGSSERLFFPLLVLGVIVAVVFVQE
ncbi:MAG: preprotein translocase subunit SecY, partial [Gaiellaceae bacterium]